MKRDHQLHQVVDCVQHGWFRHGSVILEEFIRKSWEVCGYKQFSDLNYLEETANKISLSITII